MSTQRGTRDQTDDLDARAVPAAALEHALRLAGGDRSRLRFEKDGSVTVANAPRTARPRPQR